ncbi:MAG: 30S ribosomal protein S15 [Candidatus Pacearchaeota archaeon]|nr:30S ribosomal protein S15 [Candidatus Pacearchaeota archaeon]
MQSNNTETKNTDWIKTKPMEVEKLVIELYKQNETPSKIGMILRDKYGIPKAKVLGKKITKIIKNANLPLKSEKEQILAKIENMKRHLEKNKKDKNSKRYLTKLLWMLEKLNK